MQVYRVCLVNFRIEESEGKKPLQKHKNMDDKKQIFVAAGYAPFRR
jgi:hypothetical protein